ncbi:MAG: heavy metal-responsive transcriptional regulator [Chloroflexi bacterium]|nr:heavy metal-responsive transcriptional regulator [Chloroflexota bacterium]
MRIGELADRIGVTADTVRFYERAGWLPRPPRQENGYREYAEADAEHLRLLIDLRRLELPLEEAARLASYCHSGHCADTASQLPSLIAERRADIGERMDRLRELDARLADLERHVTEPPRRAGFSDGTPGARAALSVLDSDGPCCDAAVAIEGVAEGGCACCTAPAG